MKINALLPMKGNSERVKNKNMKDFDGFPLYHAVMKVLLRSSYVDKIFINTDSDTIVSDVNKNFSHDRVVIIKRPKEIQGDFVSMNDIIAYDLTQCNGKYFLQTHSTNPLLKTSTIDLAIKKFFDSLDSYDSLFSVTKVQTRFYDKNANAINHNPNELLRTQDLEPMYEENSNFYIFSKESFDLAGKKRIGLRPQIFSMNKLEAIDIDNPEDFILAELLYKNRDII
ncbi:acylneuraminate cytidylyltransferase family protein [Campylobacter lari]|uniref:acylneuraminate cytidylyltransferase family protein n=2 Tax=Campylobacter lari TaxID=201 RepID=UPI001276C62D|nr:acylneuraminate cytidylyltransferase family protein [Campylobacter lari]EAJ8706383.1 acylneuraminate cytidylyltransferase family protein [Campylobacter jejuni]EAI7253435.1 acylneuraminate cytidylyltransferase family protein [Campylobacter lari]EAK0442347.1 acylneuraminate cytidylyltransferase family protein [Campylobacter lari]EAL0060405.1 acylneuraminate cytidylyltransferase family protein [Campylobacter lari]ECL4969359.1 acylneuraminate cytidylyltransferase family protein [Campylobacter l